MDELEFEDAPEEGAGQAAGANAPEAPRPTGALTAMAPIGDPLAGLDPEQLMRGARGFLDPNARRRAMAAAVLKPRKSQFFGESYGNMLAAGNEVDTKQAELLSRYMPVVQRAVQARQMQRAQAAQQQSQLLNNTAFAALNDPTLTPESLSGQINALVDQGRVPGELAERFLRSMPQDPAQLRQRLTTQAIATLDPMRAVAPPKFEKLNPGQTGYNRNVGTGELTETGRAGAAPTPLAKLIDEFSALTPEEARGTKGAFYRQAITKATTHPPSAQMIMNPEKPMINSFMDIIGKSAGAAYEGALAAKSSLDTSGRLLSVLENKNLIAGPGAPAGVLLAQIAELGNFGGKDNREKLANTRAAMQAMAQLELDAAGQMKGQGAITEGERALLAKVASGNINMTREELRALAIISQRIARRRIATYNTQAQRITKLKGMEAVAPLLEVDLDEAPAAYNEVLRFDAQGRPIDPNKK